MKKFLAILLTVIMVASLSFTAFADEKEVDWPKTSVQLVCAYAAGGGTDLFARMMAQGLADVGNFGVVNNTDGGGVIGWEQVRTSNPAICDQLIFGLNSMFLTYLSGVSDINPMTDIQPVWAADANSPYYVVVNKNAPYDTLEEMIAYGNEHPGELTLGAGAPGSSMTIFTGQFIANTGINVTLVATSGGDADAVAMVMGGNMSCYLTNESTTQNYLQAGEIKVLASIHPRSGASAEILDVIPTLEELGFKNVTMGTQFIIWAPVGADPAVYEWMNKIFNTAFESEVVQTWLKEQGRAYVSYGDLTATNEKLGSAYADCAAAWDAYLASVQQ